jgi:hypothetical protein
MPADSKILKEAIEGGKFDPSVKLPEQQCSRNEMMVSQIFETPVFVWTPGVLSKGVDSRPVCVKCDGSCEIHVNKYCSRLVHDFDHVTRLLFVEYFCKKGKGTFSTLSPDFLKKLPTEIATTLPYLLTHQSGVSFEVMGECHEGIMQPKGLAPVLRKIDKKRRNRYLFLRQNASFVVKNKRKKSATYEAPNLISVKDYMEHHKVFDSGFMYSIWMSYTEPYVYIDELIRRNVYAERCYRFDGTFKIAKKIVAHDETNRRVNPSPAELIDDLTG